MEAFKNASCFQAGIGISANTFLFLIRILTLLLDSRPRPADLITCHLAFIHTVMLLILLFLVSPDLFESLKLPSGLKCKAFVYTSRVMRGLSICTTCLLSMLQAVTICPSTSWLARFKKRLTKYLVQMFLFLWSLSLCLSCNLIFDTVVSTNESDTDLLALSTYCSLGPMDHITRSVVFTLTLSRDLSFIGIMLFSSLYMVHLLFRHRRRCQHLHGTNLSPRVSPEMRATQTILLLVSVFVVMYWVDFLISSSSTLLWVYDPVMLGVQSLVANVYASVSPLVLISSDRRVTDVLQHMQWACH